MYQSVEDGICCCWVLHQTMPFIYRELAYHYRAALSVTILYELQKVITLGVT